MVSSLWLNELQDNNSDFVHPVAKINYIPRVIASSFFVLLSWSMLQKQLFATQCIWLIALGLVWPHLARFIAVRVKNTKRQEMLNMHLDAVFSAIFCWVCPSFYFVVAVITILVANALFIGAFRLLSSTLLAFSVTFALGLAINGAYLFVEPSKVTNVITAGSLILYFATFSAIGNRLTRQMIELNKQVRSLSITDPLTHCFNRLYLDRHLTRELHRSYRMQYPLTLIFADLDHFKAINDQYGHHVGDKILKEFVKVTNDSIRNDVDWIARYGGEEFVIVLPNSDAENGKMVAERIRESLNKQNFSVSNHSIDVTCSFGVSSVQLDQQMPHADTLIAQADSGLYQAKANGRNRVELS